MTDSKKRRLIKILSMSIATACMGLPTQHAAAQPAAWPTKPVRLVVPWAPGTPADVIGRIVTERMSVGLGQPMYVENRPGATGTIGLGEVLRQPADGYNVYMLSSASLVAPILYPSQSLDFLKSLDPVGMAAWSYNVLVVPANSPFKSVRDLEAAAKAKPGTLTFGSGGNGTPAHLAGKLFEQVTGTQLVHVPYNQFSMVVGDLLPGRLDLMFLTASMALPYVQSGKVRALAVASADRLPALPDVPTMAEQGYVGLSVGTFEGIAVRHGTPHAIIERLNAELNKALDTPEVREKLAGQALKAEAMTPEQFRDVIATESDKALRLARSANVKVD